MEKKVCTSNQNECGCYCSDCPNESEERVLDDFQLERYCENNTDCGCRCMSCPFILKCIGLPLEVCKNIDDISQSFGVVFVEKDEKEVVELIKSVVNDGFSYLNSEITRILYHKVIDEAVKKFHLRKCDFGFYIHGGVSHIQYLGICFKNFDELKKLI